MDFIKNAVVAIIVTVAVFGFAHFVGEMAINPKPAPSMNTAAEQAAPEAEPAPAVEVPVVEAPVVEAVESAVVEATNTIPVADEMATADAKKGARTFKSKCMGCHTAAEGDRNRTGPNLWGVIGRERGTVEGYRYSKSMKAIGGVWTVENLSDFMANPRANMPGTKMTYAGLGKAEDRANVIAHLMTLRSN